MELSKCPYRSTVTKIQPTVVGKLMLDTFGRAEFNGMGGELPQAVMAPESSSTVVNPPKVDRRQWQRTRWRAKPNRLCATNSSKLRRKEANLSRESAASIGGCPAISGDVTGWKMTVRRWWWVLAATLHASTSSVPVNFRRQWQPEVMASSQASDGYLPWPVRWPESRDPLRSISDQTGRVRVDPVISFSLSLFLCLSFSLSLSFLLSFPSFFHFHSLPFYRNEHLFFILSLIQIKLMVVFEFSWFMSWRI